ncbi:hypothetical protein L917_07518 [Phytophthora nicotianae]|uniref:Secreted protein n=1 Tax=Phytophthora nicotianae TaxID=4792 RepID=W2LCS3_PHYNI|nr:hypothetical protein L916_07635 [Phytophthora nicotianae]ETL94539.1 hypothetical protein L917_07518 [Phytophthora nicotianae]
MGNKWVNVVVALIASKCCICRNVALSDYVTPASLGTRVWLITQAVRAISPTRTSSYSARYVSMVSAASTM